MKRSPKTWDAAHVAWAVIQQATGQTRAIDARANDVATFLRVDR
jgi:hypothetical protein